MIYLEGTRLEWQALSSSFPNYMGFISYIYTHTRSRTSDFHGYMSDKRTSEESRL